MAPQSILIVGCGIAGPVLATFLLLSTSPALEKPHITILERASGPRPHGQNIDIRGAGMTIIRKLGLESTIRSSLTGEEGVKFVDGDNRSWAEFAADKSGQVQTGTSDIEILRGRLAQICFQCSLSVSEDVKRQGGAGVDYLYGDHLETLEQDEDKVHVRFAKSGEKRSYDLLVGADGLQSRTRSMAFGKEGEADRVWRTGVYGGFFSMPRGRTDSQWRRWYHAPGKRGIMVRPSDQSDRATVFMYTIHDEDERLRNAAADGRSGMETQKALLREYFHDAGWEMDRILKEMDAADDFYYDMVAQVKMDSWSNGRVVLLGDAGYCASPISGMGTTLALNGAYNLAGALTKHPQNHKAAFTEYEEAMRPIVNVAQKLPFGGRGLSVLTPETAWGIWVMRIINWLIWMLSVDRLMFRFVGPSANEVPVTDYGFCQLSDDGKAKQ